MSLLARLEGNDPAAFEELAQALLSQDNAARKQAEEFYKDLLKHKPDLTVRYLVNGLSHSNADMKHFCCVYLRKAVRSDGVWDGCTPETKELTKQQGMAHLAQERSAPLMHKLADAMSQVAYQTWDNPAERWTGVMQHMQEFIMSNDAHLLEAALTLFAHLTEWLDADEYLQPQAPQMQTVLLNCLQHSEASVALAAVKASCNFILVFDGDEVRHGLHGLVRPMLDVASRLLVAGKELEAREVLVELAELADSDPVMFKWDAPHCIAMLLQVAAGGGAAGLDEETRQAAVEVVLLLVEGRPVLVRKEAALVGQLCAALMGMLLDIEDTPTWHTATEEHELDDGQSDLHECALQGLDRIAKPLGGKALLTSLWPIIEAWAADGDWRKRQAALCCIAQVAEGCRKVLLPDDPLARLTNVCCLAARDAHPIVKWSACQAVGQACTDLATKVQKKHHAQIMEMLLHLMGPAEEARVQAHAASAVVNFCELLDGNIVGHYVQPLVARFLELLRSRSQLVVEAALTALSSVADSVGTLFTPFYEHVMPALKAILQHATGKTQRVLCGKAIECISLVGMSVGKGVFMRDAQDFMAFLMALNTTDMEPDNPMLTYVQSAGTRMCKCLGVDFVPLLPQFVPPLLESAGRKAELTTVEEDEVDEADEEREYHQIGDKFICINTTFNEEKENALNMLSCYVDHLKEHFAPYCEAVAERVEHVLRVPVLNNSEMRKTAAAVVSGLVNDMQLARTHATWPHATPERIQELFARLIKALLKGIDTELEHDVLHEMFDAMDTLVEIADEGLLSDEVVAECFQRIALQVKNLMAARQDRSHAHRGNELEPEDAERLLEEEEEEDEVMQQVISAAGAFLRKVGDRALPRVEELLKAHFNDLLFTPARSDEDRWLALMVFTDVLEFAPSSGHYVTHLLPRLLEGSVSSNRELVNVSLYGLGVVAQKHPTAYAAAHEQVLPVLLKVIDALRGNEEWSHARDNAAAALGKVLFAHPSLTAGTAGIQLGKIWLDCLPLTADDVEGSKQHNLLLQLVRSSDVRVLGESNGNLGQIADVFVRVIAKGEELLEEGAAEAFVAFFLQQLRPVVEQQGLGGRLQQTVAGLDPRDQERLKAALGPTTGPGP